MTRTDGPHELEYGRAPARWRAVVRRVVRWGIVAMVVAEGVW